MFKALGLSEEQRRNRFGFFLDALTYGTPPHGGIALGLDRVVGAARRRKIHPRNDRVPENSQGARFDGRLAVEVDPISSTSGIQSSHRGAEGSV